MDNVLKECTERFGVAPRRISIFQRWGYLGVPFPQWLLDDRDDDLMVYFGGRSRLLKEGMITWGCVIQANGMLYEDGSENHPGELVYSIENQEFERVVLDGVARRLFRLKGTSPEDSNLAAIADYLADERTRVYGWEVPESVSPDLRCHISTTYFVRKHLPGGKLNRRILPILVLTNGPRVVMPLPGRYWPEEFSRWWAS